MHSYRGGTLFEYEVHIQHRLEFLARSARTIHNSICMFPMHLSYTKCPEIYMNMQQN